MINISKPSIVLDTSVLINHKDIIERISNDYQIIIPIVVIEELDHLKTNKDEALSKRARRAIRSIEKNIKNFDINRRIANILLEASCNINNYNLNDDIIVSCASFNGSFLSTDDLSMKVKAEFLKVPVVQFDLVDSIYRGYSEFNLTTDEYNSFWENRKDYFSQFYVNQYILIKDLDTQEIKGEYRFDGNDLARLKLPSSKVIKGKNFLQRCALDMLGNNDIEICAVLGSVGSGKTLLGMRMALQSIQQGKQSKILGVREPIGEGHQIGYLKGDFEDKTKLFFTPFTHSLDGGEYELQMRIDRGELETQVPYFLKGTTYNSTIILVDEAEDLSEKQIRLIGTRLGENSRIFFSGDFGQAIFDSTTSNPLVKMCEELKGNPKFSCIYLDEDVRSAASKIFADLYKK